ncbi:hypothetical protein FQA39_LY06536 [Lamprigera yunnana]|nr:hypothetical protein FQA39_LY06536 [Lamprigera yunnana]
MAELQQLLPPGWDRMLDSRTGKHYYVNHYTKTTTWDDPRLLNKTRHLPPVIHPMPVEQIVMQDLGSTARCSPRNSRLQDTNLGAATSTDEAVTKISAMFPTVSDTHIRLLLKKYHNREALVISALQVEKHPITTPGPFTTPPPARNIHPSIHAHLQMTPPLGIRFGSRGGSPILRPGSGSSSEAYRNSPKPHSPKLKLRYMKFIFPKADETMILDILSNNDNNIQKVSEILLDMGFEKRENAKPVRAMIKSDPPKVEQSQLEFILPKMRTVADKKLIHSKFEEKYKDVPPQIITIALESVEFEEERAQQILDIMVQEENDRVESSTATYKEEQPESIDEVVTEPLTNAIPISQSRQSIKSLLKTEKSDYSLKEIASFSRVIEETTDEMGGDFKSTNIIETHGANRGLVRGANQDLLLEEYVKWQGPQPILHRGSLKSLAKGPNPALRKTRSYQACGPNADLCKGPKIGLAKGSIFSQLKAVVVGESRGK